MLQGSTTIGEGCRIQAGCRLTNAVDRGPASRFSITRSSPIRRVGAGARIGPFAHIRPQSDVGEDAHVGNFVELKKTSMARGAKANHLAYLGDATIGAGANIGAGTITCNYDGVHKHPTIIEDGAFIGSDSQLIAPVRIGAGAYVGGGLVDHQGRAGRRARGGARARRQNLAGWAAARRAKRAKGQS